MFKAVADVGSRLFLVTWGLRDRPGKKQQGYMYGFYPGPREFYSNLLQLPVEKQRWYELLLVHTPCKNFAEKEWVRARDVRHEELKNLVASRIL
jgi:hypothetical protein